MCRIVKFQFDEREWEMKFGHPKAKLPVREKGGQIVLHPWGRRPQERGKLPVGGIARRSQILGGRWDRYFPKSVRVMLTSFASLDVTGAEQWFGLPKGQFVQGLAARFDEEVRIYLVVLDSSPEEAQFDLWPRILSSPK